MTTKTPKNQNFKTLKKYVIRPQIKIVRKQIIVKMSKYYE